MGDWAQSPMPKPPNPKPPNPNPKKNLNNFFLKI